MKAMMHEIIKPSARVRMPEQSLAARNKMKNGWTSSKAPKPAKSVRYLKVACCAAHTVVVNFVSVQHIEHIHTNTAE